MRVLVTGAGGMLARAVLGDLGRRGHLALPLTHADLDVTNLDGVLEAMRRHRPQGVIHLAAWTRVDAAEAEEPAATRVNALGAENVARAAAECGARLVHLSSDYVLDGAQGVPLPEDSQTRPRSAYGRGKEEGERRVAHVHPGAAILRTQWLYGAGGSNFPDTMIRLARRDGVLRVVADQWGAPTWTEELAPGVVQLMELGVCGVVHLAATGHCTWHDVASATLAFAGLRVPIHAITSSELGRPALRPAWSVLAQDRARGLGLPPMAHWADALERYIRTRGDTA